MNTLKGPDILLLLNVNNHEISAFAESGQTYSFGEELKVGISSVKDLLFNEKEQLIPT